MRMRSRCARCGKVSAGCHCDEEVCPRCLQPWRQCACERSLRSELYEQQEDQYQLDDDVADDLRRGYGEPTQERSAAYWRGYNSVLRRGTRTSHICPFDEPAERTEFFAGVSDARYRLS